MQLNVGKLNLEFLGEDIPQIHRPRSTEATDEDLLFEQETLQNLMI